MSARNLHLIGAADASAIRSAEYLGKQMIVVPVVAMVEGVVWAMNSEVPELVLASELAETPQQWNGRGCFAGHPADEGTQVTANTPRTLATSFGLIFDASPSARILQTRRLTFDAWLDPDRAAKVGPEALSVIERLQSGQTVEVSVGCFVEAEQKDGVFNGQEYHGVWHSIVADHIAFLAEGAVGACSVEAGCGAPRATVRHVVTAEGIRREENMASTQPPVSSPPPTAPKTSPGTTPSPSPPPKKASLAERVRSLLSAAFTANEGTSDYEVRRALDDALRAIEPGYQGIDVVFPDDGIVIYMVMPEDDWKLMRRSYTMAEDGVATLSDDAEEVEPKTTFVPVNAEAKPVPVGDPPDQPPQPVIEDKPAPVPPPAVPAASAAKPAAAEESTEEPVKAAAAAPCGCGGQDMTKEERAGKIAVIVANRHSGFVAGDETMLEAASDERLEALEVQAVARENESKNVKAAASTPKTAEEWLKEAPSEIVDIVETTRKHQTEERAALVTALKTAQDVYTESELSTMKLDELYKLSKVAKLNVQVDYSGRGFPRAAADRAKDPRLNPPDGYAIALEARRAAAVAATKTVQ